MTGGMAWALALTGGGMALAAVSRDQLARIGDSARAGWTRARARSRARRQLDRDGWNRP